MKRTLSILVVVLSAASMLSACGSGGVITAPPTGVPASPSALGPLPRTTPATETMAAETAGSATPTPVAPTTSPSPTVLPEVSYVPAPQPSLAKAAIGAPALPTSTRLDFLTDPCTLANQDYGCSSLRVVWQETDPSDVTIRIYAFTGCLHTPSASKPNANCLEDGDTIPTASLLLLGTAPASDRSFSFALASGGEGTQLGRMPGNGPAVQAVVLQAVNSKGGSSFAIAATSTSCYGCVL